MSRASKLCTVMLHTNSVEVSLYIDDVSLGWRNDGVDVQLRYLGS